MSAFTGDDRRWLDAATRYARPRLGTTAENPTVGALVVDAKSGTLIARAVTAAGGRPHAETQALDAAGERAVGATLYVTLEPCNHWGKTPPCTEAILSSGIARIVCGIEDPDPRTAGQGLAKLRDSGLDVAVAGDHEPSRRLHEGFLSRIENGRPFVIAKLAVSRDGMIGRPDLGNVAITGEEARRWTHMQRALSDAIMVGAGTARLDDPALTVRLKGLEDRKPVRIVVAGGEPLPGDLGVFATADRYPTWVVAQGMPRPELRDGVELIEVAARDGRIDLPAAMSTLGGKGISRLLVEGGAALTQALLAAGLIDRFELLEGDVEVGEGGVPAVASGTAAGHIEACGMRCVDRRALGCDSLRTFERTA